MEVIIVHWHCAAIRHANDDIADGFGAGELALVVGRRGHVI